MTDHKEPLNKYLEFLRSQNEGILFGLENKNTRDADLIKFFTGVLGVLSGLGFSALDSVETPLLFFLSEFILLSTIIYALFLIKRIVEAEINFYRKKIEKLDSDIKETEMGVKSNLTVEVLPKLLEAMDFNASDYKNNFIGEKIYFESKNQIQVLKAYHNILITSSIGIIFLFVSFIDFCNIFNT